MHSSSLTVFWHRQGAVRAGCSLRKVSWELRLTQTPIWQVVDQVQGTSREPSQEQKGMGPRTGLETRLPCTSDRNIRETSTHVGLRSIEEAGPETALPWAELKRGTGHMGRGAEVGGRPTWGWPGPVRHICVHRAMAKGDMNFKLNKTNPNVSY